MSSLAFAVWTVYSRKRPSPDQLYGSFDSAEYAAFGDLAGSYVAPAAAGLATFLGALWVGRKLTSAFLANGTLVGAPAVVLTGGLIFAAKPEDRFMYGVSFVLRILGGYIGGAVAQRMSSRRTASLSTLGEAG